MPRCSFCFRRLEHDAICPRHMAATLHDESRAATTPPAPPVIPGHAIAELLGAGAHAEVWCARRHRGDGPAVTTEVAIKLAAAATAHAQERAARERDMLARVGAPHVPALLDHGALEDGAGYALILGAAPDAERVKRVCR